MPCFCQFRGGVTAFVSYESTSLELLLMTKVIPLHVLYRNDQCYKDVMGNLMMNLFLIYVRYTRKMSLFHVGVDQLTIERFSGVNDIYILCW